MQFAVRARSRWIRLLAGALACAACAVPAIARAGAAPASLRIGLVATTAGLDDEGLNEGAADAVRAASVRLGARIDIRPSLTPAAYEPSLEAMAAQGYDLVIAVGADEEAAVGSVAREYPAVRFAIVGGSYRSPAAGGLANVQGLLFEDEQAGYLAGYLAALVAQQQTPKTPHPAISTISGTLDPAALRYVAGFRAGARQADPAVRLLAGFANAVTTTPRCASLARAQITAGAQVIFPVAGSCSAGAFTEAARAGVWSIGSAAAPAISGDLVLANAEDHVERAVSLMLDALEAGRFMAGSDVEVGIAQGAVDLRDLNPILPPALRRRIAAVGNRLRAGRVSVPTAPAPLS